MNNKKDINCKYQVLNSNLHIKKITSGKLVTQEWKPNNINKFACEMFIKPSDKRKNHSIIIASRFNKHNSEPNPPFPGWFLQIVGNQLSLAFGNGKTWVSVKAKKPIENNKWYHIVFSLDNQAKIAEIYVNGERNVLENINFKPPCHYLTVGALMPNGNFSFIGEIENLIIGNSIQTVSKQVKEDNIENITIEKSIKHLSDIRNNLTNIENDIKSLENILFEINSWKYRGLEIDTKLLEQQIKSFKIKMDNFKKDITQEYQYLKKNIGDKIKNEQIEKKENLDFISLYESILHNLVEDITILDNAICELSKFDKLGVELGTAFEKISEQKEIIKNTILETENKLEEKVNQTNEIMEIITINEPEK